MKINFSAMTDADRTTEFAKMSDADLTAYRTEARGEASTLFALSSPTMDDADKAVALQASIKHVETEQASRKSEATKAAEAFAAAKAQFSETSPEDQGETQAENVSDDADLDGGDTEGDEDPNSADEGDAAEGDADAGVDAAKGENPFPKKDDEMTDEEKAKKEEEDKKVTTAAARRGSTPLPQTAARKVGSKTKRPAKSTPNQGVVITAAANVPDVAAGSRLEGMVAVTAGVQSQIKNGPEWNERAALALRDSGVDERLDKKPVASFHVPFDASMVASGPGATGKGYDHEYDATKAAMARHREVVTASMAGGPNPAGDDPLTAAAAWCAPSETVYSWLADYVVDGLVTVPEVSAKRGGLYITQGPQLAQGTYAGDAVDGFGFGGTEAEMEAGYIKTCETLECPPFVDHRLDFDGYCWKIPILTETAFPELVTDAMRLTDVLYAHKMNRRLIRDILAGSTTVATGGYGDTFNDTLEALTIIAVKERRWWNLGENAIMEVKLPTHALDIFKFDMSRRTGLALTDTATDQKVAAHFAAHNLAVEYVSGLQNIHEPVIATAAWPATIPVIIYPVGTWVKAVEPVIRLSAVHDAASLSENEYTGVFFEQGIMTVKVGYRSHKFNMPVCTAGLTGAAALDCNPLTQNDNDGGPVV